VAKNARLIAHVAACAQEKQSALDELERQADLIELELTERERKLQVRLARAWLTVRQLPP
jgi:hypothetical protein